MTMRGNRQSVALPNVLREQTAPNTLSGMRTAPVVTRREQLPVRGIAIGVGAAIALLLVLLGRTA
jgi:hypothetical protein